MSPEIPSAHLPWVFRSGSWLLGVCVLLGGVLLPLVVALQPTTYEAKAFIVMSEVRTSPDILARYGEQVFDTGRVARDVTADPSIGGDPQDIVPSRLELVAAQDSIAYEVIGKDEDPRTAWKIANAGSQSFVERLQSADGTGPGVARFSLSPEDPEVRAAEVPSIPVLVALGGLSGFVLGLGLLLLHLVVRNPVIGSRDVSETVGAPLLGVAAIPRSDASAGDPMPGMADVVRGLIESGRRVVRVVSPSSIDDDARVKVSAALAATLGQRYRVHGPGDSASVAAVNSLREAPDRWHELDGEHETSEFLIIDGTQELDLRWLGKAFCVVLVPEGISGARLRRFVSQHVADDAFGVVLLQRDRRRLLQRDRRMKGASLPERVGAAFNTQHVAHDPPAESEGERYAAAATSSDRYDGGLQTTRVVRRRARHSGSTRPEGTNQRSP